MHETICKRRDAPGWKLRRKPMVVTSAGMVPPPRAAPGACHHRGSRRLIEVSHKRIAEARCARDVALDIYRHPRGNGDMLKILS